MNTQAAFQQVLQKQKTGTPVNWDDVAVIIENDPNSLFEYLLNNDTPQVWKLLNASDSNFSIGNNATLLPNAKRAAGELVLLYTQKNWNILNQVITNFVINPATVNWTTSQSLLTSLANIGAITQTSNGLQFTYRYS